MPHVYGEGLGVYTGGDHQRRIGVTAFVVAEMPQSFLRPDPLRSPDRVGGIERHLPVAEDQPRLPRSLPEPLLDQHRSKGARQGNTPEAGPALRVDEAGDPVPGALDFDRPLLQIDALPAEGLELATPKAGVDGECPDQAEVARAGRRAGRRLPRAERRGPSSSGRSGDRGARSDWFLSPPGRVLSSGSSEAAGLRFGPCSGRSPRRPSSRLRPGCRFG